MKVPSNPLDPSSNQSLPERKVKQSCQKLQELMRKRLSNPLEVQKTLEELRFSLIPSQEASCAILLCTLQALQQGLLPQKSPLISDLAHHFIFQGQSEQLYTLLTSLQDKSFPLPSIQPVNLFLLTHQSDLAIQWQKHALVKEDPTLLLETALYTKNLNFIPYLLPTLHKRALHPSISLALELQLHDQATELLKHTCTQHSPYALLKHAVEHHHRSLVPHLLHHQPSLSQEEVLDLALICDQQRYLAEAESFWEAFSPSPSSSSTEKAAQAYQKKLINLPIKWMEEVNWKKNPEQAFSPSLSKTLLLKFFKEVLIPQLDLSSEKALRLAIKTQNIALLQQLIDDSRLHPLWERPCLEEKAPDTPLLFHLLFRCHLLEGFPQLLDSLKEKGLFLNPSSYISEDGDPITLLSFLTYQRAQSTCQEKKRSLCHLISFIEATLPSPEEGYTYTKDYALSLHLKGERQVLDQWLEKRKLAFDFNPEGEELTSLKNTHLTVTEEEKELLAWAQQGEWEPLISTLQHSPAHRSCLFWIPPEDSIHSPCLGESLFRLSTLWSSGYAAKLIEIFKAESFPLSRRFFSSQVPETLLYFSTCYVESLSKPPPPTLEPLHQSIEKGFSHPEQAYPCIELYLASLVGRRKWALLSSWIQRLQTTPQHLYDNLNSLPLENEEAFAFAQTLLKYGNSQQALSVIQQLKDSPHFSSLIKSSFSHLLPHLNDRVSCATEAEEVDDTSSPWLVAIFEAYLSSSETSVFPVETWRELICHSSVELRQEVWIQDVNDQWLLPPSPNLSFRHVLHACLSLGTPDLLQALADQGQLVTEEDLLHALNPQSYGPLPSESTLKKALELLTNCSPALTWAIREWSLDKRSDSILQRQLSHLCRLALHKMPSPVHHFQCAPKESREKAFEVLRTHLENSRCFLGPLPFSSEWRKALSKLQTEFPKLQISLHRPDHTNPHLYYQVQDTSLPGNLPSLNFYCTPQELRNYLSIFTLFSIQGSAYSPLSTLPRRVHSTPPQLPLPGTQIDQVLNLDPRSQTLTFHYLHPQKGTPLEHVYTNPKLFLDFYHTYQQDLKNASQQLTESFPRKAHLSEELNSLFEEISIQGATCWVKQNIRLTSQEVPFNQLHFLGLDPNKIQKSLESSYQHILDFMTQCTLFTDLYKTPSKTYSLLFPPIPHGQKHHTSSVTFSLETASPPHPKFKLEKMGKNYLLTEIKEKTWLHLADQCSFSLPLSLPYFIFPEGCSLKENKALYQAFKNQPSSSISIDFTSPLSKKSMELGLPPDLSEEPSLEESFLELQKNMDWEKFLGPQGRVSSGLLGEVSLPQLKKGLNFVLSLALGGSQTEGYDVGGQGLQQVQKQLPWLVHELKKNPLERQQSSLFALAEAGSLCPPRIADTIKELLMLILGDSSAHLSPLERALIEEWDQYKLSLCQRLTTSVLEATPHTKVREQSLHLHSFIEKQMRFSFALPHPDLVDPYADYFFLSALFGEAVAEELFYSSEPSPHKELFQGALRQLIQCIPEITGEELCSHLACSLSQRLLTGTATSSQLQLALKKALINSCLESGFINQETQNSCHLEKEKEKRKRAEWQEKSKELSQSLLSMQANSHLKELQQYLSIGCNLEALSLQMQLLKSQITHLSASSKKKPLPLDSTPSSPLTSFSLGKRLAQEVEKEAPFASQQEEAQETQNTLSQKLKKMEEHYTLLLQLENQFKDNCKEVQAYRETLQNLNQTKEMLTETLENQLFSSMEVILETPLLNLGWITIKNDTTFFVESWLPTPLGVKELLSHLKLI